MNGEHEMVPGENAERFSGKEMDLKKSAIKRMRMEEWYLRIGGFILDRHNKYQSAIVKLFNIILIIGHSVNYASHNLRYAKQPHAKHEVYQY